MDNNYVNANSTENTGNSNFNGNGQPSNSNMNNSNFNRANNNFNQSGNFNNVKNGGNYQKAKKAKVKDTSKPGFGRTVVVPFVSGVLGAAIVMGVCFNVPTIKNKMVGKTTSEESNASFPTVNYNNVNTNLVSLSSFSDTGVAVAQKVLPSVVGIKVQYSVNTIFSRNSSTAVAEGSGVIISTDGYILTNNHVVNSSESSSSSSSFYSLGEATKITVTLYNDDTEYTAKIVGTDEQTDLAVIKIDKTDLTAATLGDSDAVQVGEWCMAIGNPLGMESSVTTGSISALNRKITDSDGKNYTLIQTDAAINSGNSGGALVNSNGEVIGINTIKASGTGVEGLGFAIPINNTKSITSDLIKYNKVKRPYIGITGTNITENTIKANPTANLVVGCYVRAVSEFSPAEKAGLKIGDIIIKADEKEVKTMDELNEIKNKHSIGDTMTLTTSRDGKTQEVTLTLAEQP